MYRILDHGPKADLWLSILAHISSTIVPLAYYLQIMVQKLTTRYHNFLQKQPFILNFELRFSLVVSGFLEHIFKKSDALVGRV
jgi:hypothetical protein